MGKHGPCYHCGVTSTPLWRNGPPEKPVLCNACGSRWRTKGTLANYTPLHARAEPDDYEDYRVSRLKTISNKNKEGKVLKRKPNYDNVEYGTFSPDYHQGPRKVLDEDTSNRSSSGSAISNSESCAQFGSADASDLTGPAQHMVWDSMVPSRKRTCVTRAKPSSVEKLTKDLYTILHEQSSYLSGSSEEDLLFESDKPMVSVEIGHGSVLIRHPSAIAREEESEASSLSVDKLHTANEAYSRLTTFPVHNYNKVVNLPSPGVEKIKKPNGQGVEQEQTKRDKSQLEKSPLLVNHNSSLRCIDLKDVVNFGEFSQLTNDEHQQLLKFLPSFDASTSLESLRSMFESPQFEENLSSFQNLLAEGAFDCTLSGVNKEDCETLKSFVLFNLTKSKWVECYNLLKDVNSRSGTSMSEVAGEFNVVATGHSVNIKRSRDFQSMRVPVAKKGMKSPKRVTTKPRYEHRERTSNDGSCFSPRSLFGLPPDNCFLVLDSFNSAECSDQDLLLDVPSNSSFPQAELLHPSSSFGAQASTSSSSGYRPFLHP